MTDDLTRINGVGAATADKLKARGIDSFAKLAELSDEGVKILNDELTLRDSIISKDWRGQAKALAENPDAEPEKVAKAEKPEKAQTVPVRINRDFWDTEGVRQRKGSVIEVTIEEAFAGLESGALSRVK